MNWMAWTLPTAVFFGALGLGLIIMTMVELKFPTTLARGFLPVATTRGDRFFISLLSAAFIHLLWLGLIGLYTPLVSLLALLWAAILMRWG
jgi:predicted small integral membrane protein